MPLGIIKPAARLAVLASGYRFARIQMGRPSAVMCLETQSVIPSCPPSILHAHCRRAHQGQQPAGQYAGADDSAGTVGRLRRDVSETPIGLVPLGIIHNDDNWRELLMHRVEAEWRVGKLTLWGYHRGEHWRGSELSSAQADPH